MAKITANYWHALDKEGLSKYSAEIKEIGISHGLGDSLQGLRANIFTGAPIVELGFSGTGKGQRGQRPTPESYGKDEREAMRQLSKVNDVRVTTHSSFGAPPLSGFGEGGFNKEVAASSIQELKKAIDFAADVTQGGPIVVHTGEWQRPVREIVEGKPRFQSYEGEPETAMLADTETGKVIPLRSDITVAAPLPEKPGLDPWANPKRDPKTGDIVWREREIRDPKTGELRKEKITVKLGDLAKEQNKSLTDIYKDYTAKETALEMGEAERYKEIAKDNKKQYDFINNRFEELEEIEKTSPNDARWKARDLFYSHKGERGPLAEFAPQLGSKEFDEKVIQNPMGLLKEAVSKIKRQVDSYENISKSYEARYIENENRIRTTKPIEEVGLQRTAESVATAAMYAYDKEKKAGLKEPLFIAPENVFAETYGGKPSELREIIQKSRNTMVQKLKTKGVNEDEAKKIASDHIKATIDIGHANTFRKYFQGTDEEFKKWLMQEMKELARDGIIGHVHLTDNFGYDDEHLTIGEGNTPIREFIDEIKKEGYKGVMIAEVGGQPEGKLHEAMLGSWRSLNSPVYRIDPGGTGMSWNDFGSYSFGRTTNPFSIVGEYSPSEEFKGSPFYSGLGLE